VGQQRALLAQQQPVVRAERPVEPQGVRGDGGGEGRARVALGDPVDRAQGGADDGEVGRVRGQRDGQFLLGRRRAHPQLELGRPAVPGVQVGDRPGVPGNQVEPYLVLSPKNGTNGGNGLLAQPFLTDVHGHRGGGDDPGRLPGLDGQRGEDAALVMPLDLVAHGLLPPPGPGEQHVCRLDRLAGAAERGRPDELPQQLPPEQPVVFQPLIAPLEAPVREHAQVEAGEKVGPQVGHDPSVKNNL